METVSCRVAVVKCIVWLRPKDMQIAMVKPVKASVSLSILVLCAFLQDFDYHRHLDCFSICSLLQAATHGKNGGLKLDHGLHCHLDASARWHYVPCSLVGSLPSS